jgi:glycosyltransferase involved in cell wall biosynthesis
MKVLIVEDALTGLKGHWFQYISDIVRDGKNAGYDVEVAIPKDAAPEVLARLPSHAILSTSLSKRKTTKTSFFFSISRIFSSNRSLYLDLKEFLRSDNYYDLIISPSTRVDHLFAYIFIYKKCFPVKATGLALIFIDALANYTQDYQKKNYGLKLLPFKFGFWLTKILTKRDNFRLLTESPEMARQYHDFSGLSFAVVPHVTVMLTLEAPREGALSTNSQDARPLVFATFGFTRYDKGLDVYQEAVKYIQEQDGCLPAQFVMQWTGDYNLPDGRLVQKDPMLMTLPQVTYLPPFVESEEYIEWIAKTDVIVIPYRVGFYRDRMSRVAVDAAIAGIPIIYPRRTWMESFVKQFASGIPFEAGYPDSLAEAIREIISRYPELKTRSESLRTEVAELYSAKSFFENLLAF